MKKSKEIPYDLKKKVEARVYVNVAAEKYKKDKDFDAYLKALMDVVEAQSDIQKSSNIQGRKAQERPVTLEQVRILRTMGLFGEGER